VRLGRETLTHYFSWSGGSSVVSIKIASGHVTVGGVGPEAREIPELKHHPLK
jgi:hypothetical protein